MRKIAATCGRLAEVGGKPFQKVSLGQWKVDGNVSDRILNDRCEIGPLSNVKGCCFESNLVVEKLIGKNGIFVLVTATKVFVCHRESVSGIGLAIAELAWRLEITKK